MIDQLIDKAAGGLLRLRYGAPHKHVRIEFIELGSERLVTKRYTDPLTGDVWHADLNAQAPRSYATHPPEGWIWYGPTAAADKS